MERERENPNEALKPPKIRPPATSTNLKTNLKKHHNNPKLTLKRQ
jgi:hypothetical protein